MRSWFCVCEFVTLGVFGSVYVDLCLWVWWFFFMRLWVCKFCLFVFCLWVCDFLSFWLWVCGFVFVSLMVFPLWDCGFVNFRLLVCEFVSLQVFACELEFGCFCFVGFRFVIRLDLSPIQDYHVRIKKQNVMNRYNFEILYRHSKLS